MMSTSEDESEFLSQQTRGRKNTHDSVIPLSQPITKAEISKKRKLHERSSSQPPVKTLKKDAGKNQTDLLRQILEKITALELKVDKLETSVKEVKDVYISKDPEIDYQLKIPQILVELETIKGIVTNPGSLNPVKAGTPVTDSLAEVMDTTSTSTNIKPEEVIPEWNKYLGNRKSAFRKYVTNAGRYNLFSEWLSQTPPFIPAEFLPKEMRFGESERAYEVRRNQKRGELDCHMELLNVRKDEGFTAYQSVDTFIEESIEELVVDNEAKASLREVYKNKIEEMEKIINNQWEKTKVGLSQKPDREKANKIIVSDDRIYAKSQKKDKSKKKPTDAPKDSNEEEKSSEWVKVSKGKKSAVKKTIGDGEKEKTQEVKKKPKSRNGFAYHQQFHNPWFNYQMPSYHNVSVPPPGITMPQPHPPQNGTGNIQMSSGVKPPQNPFFHWGTPKNRWKNLNPNTPL